MASSTKVFDQDSYVSDAAPDTNYGSSDELHVYKDVSDLKNAENRHSFASVDFSDLTDLTDSSQVTSASCFMYMWGCGGCYLFNTRWMRVVPGNGQPGWAEGTVTWNNQPGNDPTIGSDEVLPGDLSWTEWDITPMIEDAVDNRGSVWNAICYCSTGIPEAPVWAYFHSKEYADSDYHPYIVINYTVEEGKPRVQALVFN